jgi:prolyl-tRNA synthetase
MRFTALLGKTLREPPSDAHLASHQLLVRGAYLRAVEPGLFAWLPLGSRILDRLEARIRHEMSLAGAQPVVLPSLVDSAPEAVLLRLVQREVDSYRQLPLLLFRTGTRLEPEPRVRDGLFGAARRPVLHIHAFEGAGLAEAPPRAEEALAAVLQACELPWVRADAGDEGQRFCLAHPAGDEELARCPACDYAAQRRWATTAWPKPPDEAELPPEEVETPGCDTIAALADYLDIPKSRTLKMVFFSVDGSVTCLVIRGDRTIDEAKLARVLGTGWYYPSLEHELAAVGAVGGYASPIGLDQSRVRVVADPSVRAGKNFVSGANRPDFHIRNVNVPRDFAPGEWADLALLEAGDPCPHCDAALALEPAFTLVARTAPAPCRPEAQYLDREGRGQPLWTMEWQVDLARLLAAVAEEHHDDHGLLWPAGCAPVDLHLVALDLRREEVAAQAEALYAQLEGQGLSVLFDDRDASAGVKFNDADLLGIPLRLTLSKRSAADGLVEAKWRHSAERLNLDAEGLEAELGRLG